MAGGEKKGCARNPWAWGIGGCCLGCVLLPVLFVTVLGGGAFWAFRSSGVNQEALELARAHPEAVEALGEPIEAGWLVQGSINVSNDRGEADFSIPVSGPRGEGRLYIVAERRAGEWEYQELLLRVEGRNERIDLLAGEPRRQLEESPAEP